MLLRTQFILAIGSIITIAFGITFYKTYSLQNDMIYEQSERQVRLLAEQILLTRKWVADHNGVFLLAQPGTTANPFLDKATIQDSDGNFYVKRNPAMVTRELSEYANQNDIFSFRVTSLHTVNAANVPDAFEKESLEKFDKGVTECITIEKSAKGRMLRYIKPLITEESCLECHSVHGYKTGDIRGGLSLHISLDWADRKTAANLRLLVIAGFASVMSVGLAIILLIEKVIVVRLNRLKHFFSSFPEYDSHDEWLTRGSDEISDLGRNVIEMRNRLINSQLELQKAQEGILKSEKLAALGRLSAGVAHEINNPLGGMRNCIKSLNEHPDDNALRKRYLPLIDKGLLRIENVVRQLLNFSRKEPLRYRAAIVDDVIHECLLLLEYRMKNIDLALDLHCRKQIMIDVEALKQIVFNIVLNGIQAVEEKGSMKIMTRMAGSNLEIRFTDNGPGIPEMYLDKIFDPFFTTKKEGQGTGLGLAVTYSLVETMKGKIEVISQNDQGCDFIITLPVSLDNLQGDL